MCKKQALFRVVQNKQFSICPSYHEVLILPATVDDAVIAESAKFRSSSRLPCLTYYDKVATTSIWRCSQPHTGLFNSRSKADEELFRLIGLCNSNPMNVQNTVLIHDSRPLLNAMSNKLKGGGYEDVGPGNNYPNCKIKFADIDNIHAVTKCYDKLF